MPYINALGDALSGYEHPISVKTSFNVYPGEETCRYLIAHAKWHEQSANALIDLIYLTDDVHNVLTKGNLSDINNTNKLTSSFAIMQENDCFAPLSQKEVVEAMMSSPTLACLSGNFSFE